MIKQIKCDTHNKNMPCDFASIVLYREQLEKKEAFIGFGAFLLGMIIAIIFIK